MCFGPTLKLFIQEKQCPISAWRNEYGNMTAALIHEPPMHTILTAKIMSRKA